ncbi:arabinogalactan endo-beta-1,4-galactanase [Halolactibacillus alkaliphilus]|uniref:Arabinogalactan endo-beta-1,4-galactanase n=1 Tax=Halolactibacillus alkaliphilus TaxID=442899 RepID=A0A511X086_9BACI|nr:glycosyl hydrolase 53 family protein [Halolactibacillus alkaliphilus]GEN56364.1 arabinogalactan endo-beta-1,4-galactanase [Halolactibacillus alkaliphilus]GGN67512.1 arabinogalactan endo-beta-1,4-galactanase [Halolactibacillus alkaliphilus]SFO91853.1 arabinogalactan endo-1,4-beta-galactosidase [Halolactibacillus alkaliphilus]
MSLDIRGVDVSMQKAVENGDGKFYKHGQTSDIFNIYKSSGVNLIRLRLWVNPYNEAGQPYGGGTNDLQTTIALAKRLKAERLAFMLNLHYSDFWADPGKQVKPKDWEKLSFDDLQTEVYRYTKDVLRKLEEQNVLPEYVQVGNEVTNGMLWPDGKTPIFSSVSHQFEDEKTGELLKGQQAFDRFSALLKAGIKAAREYPNMKVILHLDFGGASYLYERWFKEITARGVEFDVIGLSYYPFWHGTLVDLTKTMIRTGKLFKKDLIVVETAFGFTDKSPEGEENIFSDTLAQIAGYPASPEGQTAFLTDLTDAIDEVKGDGYKGLGFVYWEPSWLPIKGATWATQAGMDYINERGEEGNHWANQGLFDFNGHALPGLDVFKR